MHHPAVGCNRAVVRKSHCLSVPPWVSVEPSVVLSRPVSARSLAQSLARSGVRSSHSLGCQLASRWRVAIASSFAHPFARFAAGAQAQPSNTALPMQALSSAVSQRNKLDSCWFSSLAVNCAFMTSWLQATKLPRPAAQPRCCAVRGGGAIPAWMTLQGVHPY